MLQLEVPLTLIAIDVAQDSVMAWAAAQDLPGDVAYKLRLVLEELLVNLVQHGVFLADQPDVRLDLSVVDGLVAGRIEDAAAPFDPRSAPEPAAASVDDDRVGGLGLALVRRVTSDLVYGRAPDGWNRTDFTIPLAV